MDSAKDYYRVYGIAESRIRRQCNQAFFSELLISEDDSIEGRLAPFRLLLGPRWRRGSRAHHHTGSVTGRRTS